MQRPRSSAPPASKLRLLSVAAVTLTWLSMANAAQTDVSRSNPEQLPPPNGYAHVVTARPGRLVAISGQVALNAHGQLVGKDAGTQAAQVFDNLQRALTSAGLGWADVIRLDYYLTDINDLSAVRQVRDRYLKPDALPASTLVQVQQLVRPELKLEIAALAVAPYPAAAQAAPLPSAISQKTRHP